MATDDSDPASRRRSVPESIARIRELSIQILEQQLRLAHTILTHAEGSPFQDDRENSQRTVRRAIENVERLSRRMHLAPGEQERISAELAQLAKRLEQFFADNPPSLESDSWRAE